MEKRRQGSDAHCHTTNSDGKYTVQEVIREAQRQGLRYLAITDHNTVTVREPILVDGLTIIPGVECDCCYVTEDEVRHDIHVIGLFFRGVPEALDEMFQDFTKERKAYVTAILKKLQVLGLNLSFGKVFGRDISKKHFGRMTIAKYMVDKGLADSIEEAFTQYLGVESKYYVNLLEYIPYPSFEQCCMAILENAGIPVLCHPLLYRLSEQELDRLVGRFREITEGNAAAMEVYYGKYSSREQEYLEKLAEKNGLLKSAGSDSHGPETPLCRGDDTLVEKMVMEWERSKALLPAGAVKSGI